jgi:hypothetical protein
MTRRCGSIELPLVKQPGQESSAFGDDTCVRLRAPSWPPRPNCPHQVAVQHFEPGVCGRTGPLDPPPGEDHALVGEGEGPMGELFDQKNRDAGVSHLLQALENRLDDNRCKTKRRLIRNEELGFACERPAQRSICCSPPDCPPARCCVLVPRIGKRVMARSAAASAMPCPTSIHAFMSALRCFSSWYDASGRPKE